MRAILAMTALFAVAIGAFFFYQQRLTASELKSKQPQHQDTAPDEIATPLEAQPNLPRELLWKVDERWVRAENEGNQILEQIRELYRWQEEEGGDPLRFRREKKELAEQLDPVLQGLLTLQAELEHHPGAVGLIEVRVREFSGAMSGVLR